MYYSSIKKNQPNFRSDFKSSTDFESRLLESARIREKYPDRIPVICQKNHVNSDIPYIDKIKYLVPDQLSIGQFSHIIRKRLTITPEKAIFLFINNTIPTASELMSTIYNNHADEDGFLYITYSGENTFG
tara:strand:- start:29 stop:418 length:390 start_codon:yes stop_codon:yes gene_type:complete